MYDGGSHLQSIPSAEPWEEGLQALSHTFLPVEMAARRPVWLFLGLCMSWNGCFYWQKQWRREVWSSFFPPYSFCELNGAIKCFEGEFPPVMCIVQVRSGACALTCTTHFTSFGSYLVISRRLWAEWSSAHLDSVFWEFCVCHVSFRIISKWFWLHKWIRLCATFKTGKGSFKWDVNFKIRVCVSIMPIFLCSYVYGSSFSISQREREKKTMLNLIFTAAVNQRLALQSLEGGGKSTW